MRNVAKFRENLTLQQFKVIQGHRSWIDLLTVEHILISVSCIDFDIIRQNFYTASNLEDLFHNIHPKRIVSFVHAIGLTNKLHQA